MAAEAASRTRTIEISEEDYFEPSDCPRLTQEQMVFFARTIAWAADTLERDDPLTAVRYVPCRCCQQSFKPGKLLEHATAGDPSCDRDAWAHDFSDELYVER